MILVTCVKLMPQILMTVTFGSNSWVNAILNMSLLLHYVFAAVAKWEGDKCNYQFFLWSLLVWENARTFTEERCATACITGTRGGVVFFISFQSQTYLAEKTKVYDIYLVLNL